jgi:glycosyltransferase involved in cell wall biosynthesis
MTTTSAAQPLVSIVIPAYNCASLVRETLESCFAQTYPNLEIIVVNDGSIDGTAALLDSYVPRIRVLHKPNGGLASARNAGHEIAKGDYVAWLDADDIAHPDRIALQVTLLQREPSVVAVCSDFSTFISGQPDFESSHVGTYYSSFAERGRAPKLFERSSTLEVTGGRIVSSCTYWVGNQFHNLIWGNFVHPPTLMARKAALDAVGPHDMTLSSGTDYELILRLSRQGPIAFIDASLLRYRRSDQQMSESFVRGETWSEYRVILERFKAIEPQLFERQRALYASTVAESYIYEAQTIGNKDRLEAFRLLLKSLSFSFRPSALKNALIFVLTPDFIVGTVRRYRRWARRRQELRQAPA